jgi:hypothetical protein
MRKLIAFIVAALLLYMINNINPYSFQNGDILYPDMCLQDTMVVIDSEGLNHDLNQFPDASCSEINFIINKYCKKYTKQTP